MALEVCRAAIEPVRAPAEDKLATAPAAPSPSSVPCRRLKPALSARLEALVELPAAFFSAERFSRLALLSSTSEPSTLQPIEASSDCQPAPKLSAPAPEDDRRLRAAVAGCPAPCTPVPSALTRPCAGVPRVPISIAAATVMRRNKAEGVPKGAGNGLEHCQELNR